MGVSLIVHVKDVHVIEFLRAYFVPYFDITLFKSKAKKIVAELIVDIDAKYNPPVMGSSERILVDGSKGFLSTSAALLNEKPFREMVLYPMKTFVSINRIERKIILKGATAASMKIPVLRVIEDLIQIEIEKAGGIFLHSSGIVLGAQGVLAIGDKHVGKTSFLTNSLSDFDCKKLNNDVAVLFLKGNKVFARGWPSFFKADLGTIAYNRQLINFFPKEKEDLLQKPANLWEHSIDKVTLYPAQAAQVFNKQICVEAKVKTIILPTFSRSEIAYKKITPGYAELVKIFTTNLQGSFNLKHSNWHCFSNVSKKQIIKSVRKISKILLSQATYHSINWAPSYVQMMTEIEEMGEYFEIFQDAKSSALPYNKKKKWPPLPPTFDLGSAL